MAQAIIIVGHERRFYRQSVKLSSYLRNVPNISRLHRIYGWNKTPEEMDALLRKRVAESGDETLLIAYTGHGLRKGWAYGLESRDRSMILSYQVLANILIARAGCTLVLNDCCHAAALSRLLHWGCADPQRIGVLAACGAEQVSYGDMLANVLEHWRSGRPYRPTEGQCVIEHVILKPPELPRRIRLHDWWVRTWSGFLARLHPRRFVRKEILRMGDGFERVEDRQTIKRYQESRWGAVLDHHFFSAKP